MTNSIKKFCFEHNRTVFNQSKSKNYNIGFYYEPLVFAFNEIDGCLTINIFRFLVSAALAIF